ncbi:MAG: ATP-dependent DNA helicase RecG [Candidatus Niyogibacteria bacterium]|nr:ATP-dependent DNA helicase RecG [Candidatus Niyogibacteria bacterium]
MQLNDLIADRLHLKLAQQKILKKLGLETTRDLLYHFPSRYEENLPRSSAADLSVGDKAEIAGKILETRLKKTWQKKLNIAEITVSDGTAIIRAVWFHQPYLANTLKKGANLVISGKISQDKRGLYFANPHYRLDDGASQEEKFNPIYPETKGLSSRWFKYAIQKIIPRLDQKKLIDPIPNAILEKYHLPGIYHSLIFIHAPRRQNNCQAARKRFAFEEIFLIQLARMKEKIQREKKSAFLIADSGLNDFLKSLPYELTGAQNKALADIIKNLKGSSPMARLLEGDVGSGKTAVAVAASWLAVKAGYQVAYMAPTEVLARQHFKEFCERFSQFGWPIKIGLITSSECLKFPSKTKPNEPTHIARSQLLRWLKQGETPMLIGTHSLIQKSVQFKNLALVIIDEQHRFGVNQRAELAKKEGENAPHLLSMTATPIPRTLALTIYGDLDLTLLDEMPPQRKNVITKIVPLQKRNEAYEKIRQEIKGGRQAYVVCPRIDLAEQNAGSFLTLNMKAVKEEHRKLSKEIFPEFSIGMLYSKMKPKEKEKIMADFKTGKIKILVATSVIEVGINVPNATIILIEGAERFGLAQLHQLRGRVIRSTYQPYCFIFSESKTQKTLKRLKSLVQAKNGFELAEYDLMFRGPGELSGRKQWGISDIGMEALKNIKMVEAAREEARALLEKDLNLNNWPELKNRLSISQQQNIHFE